MRGCSLLPPEIQQHRVRQLGTAALEDTHRELSFVRRECQTQRRRGGARLPARSSPHYAPAPAFAGGDLEPAQCALVMRTRPDERRAAFGRTQRLLAGPQCVALVDVAHDDEARKVEPGSGQRGGIGAVGRSDPHDEASLDL